MMFDRDHLKKNNVSYWSHLFFALSVSLRLLTSAVFLGIHSLLPMFMVPKALNLENMAKFLAERDNHQKEWSNKGDDGEDWF